MKDADIERISQILASYGRSCCDQPADQNFWYRIQRTLDHLGRMKKSLIQGRRKKQRKRSFFLDKDPIHKRLELLRELFFDPSKNTKEVCLQFGISLTSYYRLVKDYRLFGSWAIIPAHLPGKEAREHS